MSRKSVFVGSCLNTGTLNRLFSKLCNEVPVLISPKNGDLSEGSNITGAPSEN